VKIWDSATGKELLSLKGYGRVAFSPDGQRLASASADSTVKIWDSTTGKELLSLQGHAGEVDSVAFSPDGQRLAWGSDDGTVQLWDSAIGKDLFARKGHDDLVYSVAFSPDGQRLASASKDRTVKIWDCATGKELFSLKGHASDANSVAFSPDGRRLASGSDDQTVKIWDSATGKELFARKGHFGNVNRVAFSPDGQRLASGSEDNTVKIWDSASGKELFSLKGHAHEVFGVAFSPDGQRLASGSWDQTVKIWDSATGKELFTLKHHADRFVTGGIMDRVNCVAFAPDGRRLASGSAGTVTIWETSVPPEEQDRRAAHQLVADLFRQWGLRADVLEWLRTVPGMSPSRRQEAVTVAQTYPENPELLNQLARQLVKLPGGETSGYRKALRYSEEACQLEPVTGAYLTTLGVAYYRVGNDDKALETLLRADKINQQQEKGSIPADLAFLAMTQQHLGHAKEAQAELKRLRERMKDPRLAQDAEAEGFLREAEALLANPKTPGDK
jgi:dipeptidyl aminopeptidase/acylaminoacyl peptidase